MPDLSPWYVFIISATVIIVAWIAVLAYQGKERRRRQQRQSELAQRLDDDTIDDETVIRDIQAELSTKKQATQVLLRAYQNREKRKQAHG